MTSITGPRMRGLRKFEVKRRPIVKRAHGPGASRHGRWPPADRGPAEVRPECVQPTAGQLGWCLALRNPAGFPACATSTALSHCLDECP